MSDEKIREAFTVNKIAIVVPTYNNAGTLASVLNDLLLVTDQIIVVNDGSSDSTSEILTDFSITAISYERNRGKGFAIRTGFKRAVELGFDYVITIDSDGQHFASDIPQFVEALPNHPNAIIIGARNMDQSSVPGKSSFGNRFSNFWFWFETGKTMPDTQSGFRLYPIKTLKSMTFVTRKYEFEIEVLVRAAWSGVEVVSVPVKVFYADKAVRVSHFRPFTDFARISVLNTVLVTIALFYIKPRDFFRRFTVRNFLQILRDNLFSPNQSNAVKATSVALGVFIGIIPIWGFQSITAIALAVVLKLNKALVIVASNISIPPLFPFIIYGSMMIGSLLLSDPITLPTLNNITLDFAWQSLRHYVVGSVVLASFAGLFFGSLTYGFLELTKKGSEVSKQKLA